MADEQPLSRFDSGMILGFNRQRPDPFLTNAILRMIYSCGFRVYDVAQTLAKPVDIIASEIEWLGKEGLVRCSNTDYGNTSIASLTTRGHKITELLTEEGLPGLHESHLVNRDQAAYAIEHVVPYFDFSYRKTTFIPRGDLVRMTKMIKHKIDELREMEQFHLGRLLGLPPDSRVDFSCVSFSVPLPEFSLDSRLDEIANVAVNTRPAYASPGEALKAGADSIEGKMKLYPALLSDGAKKSDFPFQLHLSKDCAPGASCEPIIRIHYSANLELTSKLWFMPLEYQRRGFGQAVQYMNAIAERINGSNQNRVVG